MRHLSPHPRRLALLLLAGTLLCALAAPAADARTARYTKVTRDRLDRALRTTMARTKAPGVIAGVWVGDRGWTAARGTALPGRARRPTPALHTRIGSVTKTLTGTLILQLVDEGRLRLDDTIERWFPALPDARDITVRELGEMSSGIRGYTEDGAITDRYLTHPGDAWRTGALIDAGTALTRVFAPAHGFHYSNTNFLMLGRIVERITGRPLSEVMRQRIFVPLGMRHTSYPRTRALPAPYWHGITDQGAAPGAVRDATFWNPSFAGAAGQVVSTLDDMRRWTRALGSGSLLRPATQRARLQGNPASKAGDREYAFAVGRQNGWILHSGELPGYNTQVAYLPRLKASIVVFANADIAAADGNPAPAVFAALAGVIAAHNRP